VIELKGEELKGDILDPPGGPYYGICIPTNGVVRANGAAVMGAGIAKQAAAKWPGLEFALAELLLQHGNYTTRFTDDDRRVQTPRGAYTLPYHLFAFPTKDDYRGSSSLIRIRASANDLAYMVSVEQDLRGTTLPVALPMVGCGYGRLRWTDVRPVLESSLAQIDWRVIVP
jgi:hypothetical protein